MKVFKHNPKCRKSKCGGEAVPMKIYHSEARASWDPAWRCLKCREIFRSGELDFRFTIDDPCCPAFARHFANGYTFEVSEDNGRLNWGIMGDAGILALPCISHCPFCGTELPKYPEKA